MILPLNCSYRVPHEAKYECTPERMKSTEWRTDLRFVPLHVTRRIYLEFAICL